MDFEILECESFINKEGKAPNSVSDLCVGINERAQNPYLVEFLLPTSVS